MTLSFTTTEPEKAKRFLDALKGAHIDGQRVTSVTLDQDGEDWYGTIEADEVYKAVTPPTTPVKKWTSILIERDAAT